MTQLTIVADIVAKQDKIELVKSELLKLIEPTLAEEGCINYDLHQDNNNQGNRMSGFRSHFYMLTDLETN